MNELDVQDSDVAMGSGDATHTKRNTLAWVAIVMGVFGITAGIAGIVVGNKASQELAALSDQLANQPDPFEALQSRLKDFDDRLVNVGAEVVRSNNAMRGQTDAFSRIQRSVAEVSNEMRANREQINKNTASLAALAKSGVQSRPRPAAQPQEPVATESTTAAEPASSAPAATGDARIHIIQSGDTFARLSNRYGVSIGAIVEANPGVNPNRLQIGQEVVIP